MRNALNNNPVVQIGLIGALVVFGGLIFAMPLLKGSPDEPPASTAPAPASSAADLGSSSTPGAATASPGIAAPSSSAALPAAGAVDPEALVPGRGLPKELIVSWSKGDAVVLLIVRGGGIDDQLVRRSVQALSADGEISTFVARAKNVARYSRITQPLGVSRVPALVVIRPRESGDSVPEAQASYGFRSAAGVVQAVNDALYSGSDSLPYHPG